MSINKITKGSILISLNVIIFLLSKIFNVLDLTLLTLSSAIICLSIIKFGLKYSFLILISSTITSLMFGLIEYCLIYGIFFGFYPILKFYAENFNIRILSIFIKLIYFNILLFLLGIIYIKLFLPINLSTPIIIILFVISYIIFFMYDIVLTRIISFIYKNKLIQTL